MELDPRIAGQITEVAQALDRVSHPIRTAEVRSRALRTRRSQRRAAARWRIAFLGITAVALFAVIGLVVPNNGDSDKVVVANGFTPKISAGQCRSLPRSPLSARSSHTAVWTGKEMIVWGGEQSRGRKGLRDGAAYDPQTGRWRRLPSAPIKGRFSNVAIWTGTEMIVWGGNDFSRSLRDGAIYDPTTNEWRRIPRAPMRGTSLGAAVWTGREMLVVGGLEVDKQGGVATNDGAAFNPRTNRWRRLPDSPFGTIGPFSQGTWTGHVALFVANSEFGPTRVAAYEPKQDRWEPSDVNFDPSAIASPVWDGHEVLVLVGGQQAGVAIDSRGHTTRLLAAQPESARLFGSLHWTGNRVLVWSAGITAAYVPDGDYWSGWDAIPRSASIAGETSVWTGRVLLAWGGFVNGSNGGIVPIETGVEYRPPRALNTPGGVSCPERQEQAENAMGPPRSG